MVYWSAQYIHSLNGLIIVRSNYTVLHSHVFGQEKHLQSNSLLFLSDFHSSQRYVIVKLFWAVSPNSVETPVENPEIPEPVEGELSTQLGVNVVVRADGRVYTKRIEEKEPHLDVSVCT